ncbi:S24 family peptidase [Pigmentiphaga daeguensis]|uniref:HTH cro/C1-type domain-containing protein n=1 Tax=Pigmentiphaga daeguensis TaxID=414049 RepID=A0ABN1B882_9BURK
MSFAERVKQRRKAMKMSQQQLAERAGVSQSLIAGIERGAYTQTKMMVAIAEALDVDPRWLAIGEGDPTSQANESGAAGVRQRRLAKFLREVLKGDRESLARVLGRTPAEIDAFLDGSAEKNPITAELARVFEADLHVDAGWLDRDPPSVAKRLVEASGQIAVWEHPADLPEDENRVWVDRYDLICSAGHGAVQWEIRQKNALPFTLDFFRAIGSDPKDCRLAMARGDSMEHFLFDRDMIMIDVSKTKPRDGAVYAVCFEDEFLVKQLFRQTGGALTLHSFNDRYPDRLVQPGSGSHFEILGEIVYRSGSGFTQ